MNRKDHKERKDPKRALSFSSYFEVFVVFAVQAFEVSRHQDISSNFGIQVHGVPHLTGAHLWVDSDLIQRAGMGAKVEQDLMLWT